MGDPGGAIASRRLPDRPRKANAWNGNQQLTLTEPKKSKRPADISVIKVTRLNGNSFHLNALYIETIESFPDTTITLTNGRKYVVKETEETTLKRIERYYQSVNLLGKRLLEENEDEK